MVVCSEVPTTSMKATKIADDLIFEAIPCLPISS
jgi:hypothetical protein